MMKKPLIILFIVLFTFPKNLSSQNEEAAAAIVAGLVGIGAGIAAMERVKEQAELAATEWILGNTEDFSHFALSSASFNEVKFSDLSNMSIMSFELQKYDPKTMEKKMVRSANNTSNRIGKAGKVVQNRRISAYTPNGEKLILLMINDPNWINKYGVDYSKLNFILIDYKKWLQIMVDYVKIASNNENKEFILENVTDGKITSDGVKVGKEITIPFQKLSGDMYAVSDYDDEIKLVYNERGLGIYLKEDQRLVQLRRRTLIRLNNFIKP